MASTCSTSLVPMPKARAPNAPCVAGVRVAADDRHARLGQAQLRPDHVHDALALVARCRRAGRRSRGQLSVSVSSCCTRDGVDDRGAKLGRRHVVVGGGDRRVRPAHRAACGPQAVERLRRGHLVHEVQVDVQQVVAAPRGRPRSCRPSCAPSSARVFQTTPGRSPMSEASEVREALEKIFNADTGYLRPAWIPAPRGIRNMPGARAHRPRECLDATRQRVHSAMAWTRRPLPGRAAAETRPARAKGHPDRLHDDGVLKH